MVALVSVIITTRNSAETLQALLESIKNQTYNQTEVIVVDNKSSDETVSIARKFTKRVFDKGPERSAQRNFGAKKASGEYLFFLDSDMVLDKNVIKECVDLAKKTKTTGGIEVSEKSFGKGIWAKAKILEREMNSGEDYFDAARFFPSKTFWEIGGFDEDMTGPEDWDFPERVKKKYKPFKIKSFIFHNEGNLSLTTLAKKKYYYGLSAYKYLTKQDLPLIGPKTIYFLRAGFYKNWKKLFENPLTTLAMISMLLIELLAGGLGYIMGRVRNNPSEKV